MTSRKHIVAILLIGMMSVLAFLCVTLVLHVQVNANRNSSESLRRDIDAINQRLDQAAPSDVLAELKRVTEEFRQSGFTHEDGQEMRMWIDKILEQNGLKESSE